MAAIAHYKTGSIARFAEVFFTGYDRQRPVTVNNPDVGIQTHKLANGNLAIHLLNYRYRKSSDLVEPIELLQIHINNFTATSVPDIEIHTLDDENKPGFEIEGLAGNWQIALTNVPVYAVVEMKQREG